MNNHKKMDKFSVVSLIGEGSFGKVYRAIQKPDNKTVALKIISKRGRSNKEIKNLRRECEIQSKLKHENIIEMFDSFETKNELVVVTEFSLIDLHRYLLKNGAISEERAQSLTVHLVSALYYLHSHRILHRDLKPQNVLLNEHFYAKLCDFGLARNMTMGTHVLTSIKGTPLYMAPELLAEKPYDHLADLWSLGCIIYETLVGHPPFCTTSILHLVRLIRHEEVKWPSFISSDCTSFLQGLLEKDPSLRMTWTQILCHPFVEGKLSIPEGCHVKETDFIRHRKKNKNKLEDTNISKELSSLSLNESSALQDNLTSSKDSTNAILQSDVENIETDAEEITNHINAPFSDDPPLQFDSPPKDTNQSFNLPENKFPVEIPDNACFVTGNSNLVINHMNDNFKQEGGASAVQTGNEIPKEKSKLSGKKSQQGSRNKDLEKRKLSQNLDNFSLRLGQTVDSDIINPISNKKVNESSLDKEKKKSTKTLSSTDDKLSCSENTPPCLLPGWDSCDESQSPPIENEEWLAFLHRSMQEILDGEMDSLQQQNLVSIIVAPLRNIRASPKVVECVAKLLSFPLVLGAPLNVLDCVKNVYVEVKLVPNLMYASKLLTSHKSNDSIPCASSSDKAFKQVSELTNEEIKTASHLYELVCHLVHLNEKFLSQFCDAVAILSADQLLINFLTHDFKNEYASRISNNVIALLCCVVRELPENAELVEKVIFNQQLNLISLMKNQNVLLRTRICMLFRLLGRFSLRGLQNIWSPEFRETFEALAYDSNEDVRTEAEYVLNELKQFSFYC